MPAVERRRLTRPSHSVELQSRGEGQTPLITGYAAVFYREGDASTEYRIYDDLIERIAPTAFDRAVKEDDVRALFNHDDSCVLGRTKSGTLRLSVDRKGLRFEIDPPDTQSARELMESIKRGDVSGCSFSFLPNESSWRVVDKTYYVTRDAVTLFDVGPVTFPAYSGTETEVRGDKGECETVRREAEEWARTQRPCGDSRAAILARARSVDVMQGMIFRWGL